MKGERKKPFKKKKKNHLIRGKAIMEKRKEKGRVILR